MSFPEFIQSVLQLFGSGGIFVLSLLGLLVSLGLYKFVKDWLPW